MHKDLQQLCRLPVQELRRQFSATPALVEAVERLRDLRPSEVAAEAIWATLEAQIRPGLTTTELRELLGVWAEIIEVQMASTPKDPSPPGGLPTL